MLPVVRLRSALRLGWRPRLRSLARFWAALGALAAAGGIALQVLGPPPAASASTVAEASTAAEAAPPSHPAPGHPEPSHPGPAGDHEAAHAATGARPANAGRPGRGMAGLASVGSLAATDPGLLQPAPSFPDAVLPRIADDGRTPSQVYARPFDGADPRPRIAILLAGVGLNAADSEDAIRSLPGEVTLAFSPYAAHPERLVDFARAAGHEFLVSLPMEPQGYPLNDPGDRALLTGAAPEQNRRQLEWSLSRIRGYAGATGALGLLRGERFAASPAQIGPVLRDLAARGLYYVDPRPDPSADPSSASAASAPVWARAIDLVIDEPAVGHEIEDRLAELERIAREKGSALGLAGAVRPVTVGRLAAWASTAAAHGLVIVPVSALAVAPPSAQANR